MKLKMKVLLAAYKKESEKENYSIYVDDPNIDLECCAYLHPTVYKKIFRKKKKEASQSDQRLSIIKIKNMMLLKRLKYLKVLKLESSMNL